MPEVSALRLRLVMRTLCLIHFIMIAAMAVFACGGLRLQAESSDPADLQLARLHRALNSALSEVEEEQKRFERENEARAERIRELEAERKRLSDRQASLKLGNARLEKERTEAASKDQSLEALAQRQGDDRKRLVRGMKDSVSRLEGHVGTLVPSSMRSEHLRTLGGLAGRLEKDGVQAGTVAGYLEVISRLLNEAQTCEVYEAQLQTSRGTDERGRILRLGHIASAYVTTAGVAALALRSPDGKGYRWREQLSHDLRDSILTAAQMRTGELPGQLTFPVDVTRSIAEERKYGQRGLVERFRAGGLVMYPLAAVAILSLLLIVERFWFFTLEGRASRRHATAVLSRCENADVSGAEVYCERKRGPVVRALGACIRHRNQGVVAMEDSIQEAILHELPRLERFLSSLSILATVAPLLGLLGTVTGMIRTFDMITVHGTGDPRLMASGISEALMTTATGLIIAIPILLVHNLLAGKMEQLIADTERFAASLLILLRDKGFAHDPRDTSLVSAISRDQGLPESGGPAEGET